MSSGPEFTLVLPVYNGAPFLRRSLEQAWRWLGEQPFSSELLVVDDGSTDGSGEILAGFADEVGSGDGRRRFTLLENGRNRGKGFAVRRAMLLAAGERIVFTDADLTYPIENVTAIDDALQAGADVAYGSRMHPGSRYIVAPSFFGKLFTRHFVGRTFNLITRMLVLPGVLDSQAGLKGFRRAAARELAPRIRLHRFSFDIELLFAARRLDRRLDPCPVQFVYRKEPSTVHLVRDSLAMLRDLLRVRWRGWRGAYTRSPDRAVLAELETGRPAPRRVAFVADDCGMSVGVNEGIARAAQAGMVREASLCVTGAAVEHGVEMAKAHDLALGLHLSLTSGDALGGPIRGATDARGAFVGPRRLLWNCLWRRVDRAALGREVDLQFERMIELGVRPSHLNGHHHVHCFPVVRELAMATAARIGVRWVRLPAELGVVSRGFGPNRWLLAWLARRSAPVARRFGLRALPFVGANLQARFDFGERFEALVARLPPGDYEWMLHPRVSDSAFRLLDERGAGRDAVADAELATLVDPGIVARTRRHGVVPTAFDELVG